MEPVVIEAGRSEKHYWRDLWRFRELFAFLAWRDILVRYKQTVIGVAWALLRPLLTMLVFTVVFGRVAGLADKESVPYPVLVFAAMLPWTFFSTALAEASNSLVGNANLISKIYFPRLIMPTSAVVVALIDFLISFALLVVLMVWYQVWPTWRMLCLIPLTLLAFVAALGPGLLMTAMNVKYRDFRYIIPFITQFGLYISPVGFTSERVPPEWRDIYSLNPMVGVIDGFRWAISGQGALYWPGFVISIFITFGLLVLGVWYFRRTERTFADII